MKNWFIFLFILQITISTPLEAQISDDFSDENLSDSLAWNGDTSDFIINSEQQLQLQAASVASQSYLVTESKIINTAEWSFYIKLEFNPSSNNFADIYLVSDQNDLTVPLNGYFVRIGSSADEVSLYKQSGDKSSIEKIIDGLDDRVDMNTVEMNVKVTKNRENVWELFVAPDLTQNFISEGNVTDGSHVFSRYFGVLCTYSSTRSDKFFFDDFIISGEAFSDSVPPEIDSIIVLSDSTLRIDFNEKLDASTAINPSNYFIDQNVGNPYLIHFQGDSTVVLVFQQKFTDKHQYSLNIHGVEDLFANSLNDITTGISYTPPYIVGFGDILITEIMADPTPGVDLPEYEYLELHNPHSDAFELDNVTLIVGSDTATMPNLIIQPLEYLILCQSAAVESFESYGKTIKVPNWPSLNNRGESILLLNKYMKLVFSVKYDDSWYNSIEKDDGGWSLEMIDTDYACKGKENWMASTAPSGGTPGTQNSVVDELSDLSAPEIRSIIATTNHSILVSLDEKIHPQVILHEDITILPELELKEADLLLPGLSMISIELQTPILPNELYELTIKNLSDCVGNMQKSTSGNFVLPEIPDNLDIIINEILFNPRADGVDFVELYNQSVKYIDLKYLEIANKESKPITIDHFLIAPKQFIVLTEDPEILNNHYPGIETKNTLRVDDLPSFNDDEGKVMLTHENGQIIDLVEYNEDYHSAFLNDLEGVSLERISYEGPSNDPDNWQSAASTAGFATPGSINSQYYASENSNEEITIEPRVFDPGNNGFHDFTIIKCRFSTPGNMASIQILDAAGRQIKTIISHQSIGTEEDFKWEGLDDRGREVRMGPYIVYVELYNSSGDRKLIRKKVVVGSQL